ncbi:adenylosuccinate lyase [Thermosipho atlanticus]|uniref:Adenylosuccinate lyase n=1 Tax=Thermosipho atlanticus DSM 15807 TaxID=1123380 RepID=A0A1M5QPQ0_9BACT|nr:adenylosuccinate lyase [Thermosipho atlanticus]SHH16064.1 Adenylosuccinate lyase [Thermosipho atlanticus DSM 15807]
MVERYALEPIKSLWTLENQYERWLEVELAVIRAYEELEKIPKGTYEKIKDNIYFNIEEFLEMEKEIKHDVIAFIKVVTSKMGDEAKYFHYGLTSSDVVDTANILALIRSTKYILSEIELLRKLLYEKALKYKYLPTIGRTHGVHAEPTSFGLKFLSWYDEFGRNLRRLEKAYEELSIGKLSGAVGNYANIDPQVEELALSYLSLKPALTVSQVIPRDYHAYLVEVFALIASAIERMAVEIRHLQRTEVFEVQEPFRKGQRGSSAMPHKKNPILSERLTGLARIVKNYVNIALENIVLWHERDISHSSAERFMFPDITMLVFYMLKKAQELIENLVIFEKNIRRNIDITKGLVYSQRVFHALMNEGFSREEAYKKVQGVALICTKKNLSFKKEVENHFGNIFTNKELKELFNPSYYLRNIDKIYERFEG